MRKINFLFGVLAVAATGLLSSCDWSDNDVNPKVTKPILDGNTLLVNLQNDDVDAASFALEGDQTQAQTGKKAEFVVSGNTAKVLVSARGYKSQTIVANFGENTMLSIDVLLVTEPTTTIPQASAKGTTVYNEVSNQNATTITASIALPENVVISENTTDGFSVVAYTPAETGKQNVEEKAEVDLPVLSLDCTPDGAHFEPSVTLSASTTDAQKCKVFCVSEDGKSSVEADVSPNGDFVSAPVSHFSVWNFVLKAEVVKIVNEQDLLIKNGSVLLTNGKSTITYTQTYGIKATTGAQKTGLVANFLVKQFGQYGQVSKSTEIASDRAGSANYTVKQAVKTYTFKSGERTFTATVYGAVTITIDSVTPDTSGHSGGTGR